MPSGIIEGRYTDIPLENVRYVAVNGSDTIGDGSIGKPYLTVVAAMASILDASPTKRYSIRVAPGRYSETALAIKANVFIVGDEFLDTRISNSVPFSLDASFTPAGDHRSGFVNINVASAVDLDFNALSSNEGKFYFTGCQITAGATYTAFSDINQGTIDDCDLFGGVTLIGGSVRVRNSHVLAGDISVSPRTGGLTEIDIQSTTVESNVSIGTGTADTINAYLKADVCFGTITLNGAGVTATLTNGFATSAPVELAGPTVNLVSKAVNESYTPTTPGDWSVVPTNVGEALDTLAASGGGAVIEAKGTALLSGSPGAASVPYPSITAAHLVFITKLGGGAGGAVRVTAITPGVGFGLESSIGPDPATIMWMILSP